MNLNVWAKKKKKGKTENAPPSFFRKNDGTMSKDIEGTATILLSKSVPWDDFDPSRMEIPEKQMTLATTVTKSSRNISPNKAPGYYMVDVVRKIWRNIKRETS